MRFTGHFGTIPGEKPVEHCFFCFFIVFWEKTMFEMANTMFGGFFYCFFPSNIVWAQKTMFDGKKQ
jgi:hypothetical protein